MGYVTFHAVLNDPRRDIALKLIEQFLGGIHVIVFPLIRSSHDHDNEISILEHLLVADRRL